MKNIQAKINRIINELILFQLNCGCTEIQMTLNKEDDGYRIHFESLASEQCYECAAQLNKFLQVERNEAVEDYFWELAGDDEGSDNSELQLIGQMIDCGGALIENDKFIINAYKSNK